MSHVCVFIKCTTSDSQLLVRLIYLIPGMDREVICENLDCGFTLLKKVCFFIPIILDGNFNAWNVHLNQVSEELVSLGVGATLTRSVINREVCKRGSALVECLESHHFVFLSGRFGADRPAIFTCLSAGTGSTIDLAECAIPIIEVIKYFKIVPTATRSDLLPVCVELLILDEGMAIVATEMGRVRRWYEMALSNPHA